MECPRDVALISALSALSRLCTRRFSAAMSERCADTVLLRLPVSDLVSLRAIREISVLRTEAMFGIRVIVPVLAANAPHRPSE